MVLQFTTLLSSIDNTVLCRIYLCKNIQNHCKYETFCFLESLWNALSIIT